jgi:hypothetical protein
LTDKLAAAMLRQQAAVGRKNPNAKTMNKNPTASLAPSPSVPSPSQQETDGNTSCHHSITDQANPPTAVPLSSQSIGVFVDRLFAGESVANLNFVKSHPTPLSVNQGIILGHNVSMKIKEKFWVDQFTTPKCQGQ